MYNMANMIETNEQGLESLIWKNPSYSLLYKFGGFWNNLKVITYLPPVYKIGARLYTVCTQLA